MKLHRNVDRHNISCALFFIPLSCMFLLSYLTYWNLTSNTEILGYDTYIQFFSIWRSLKPLFLVMVLIKVYFLSEYSKKQLVLISVYLLATYWICKNYHPNYYLLYAVSFCFSAMDMWCFCNSKKSTLVNVRNVNYIQMTPTPVSSPPSRKSFLKIPGFHWC